MLAEIGTIVEIEPWDDLYVLRDEDTAYSVVDRITFRFKVVDCLKENSQLIGLSGPVLATEGNFAGLVCSIIVRATVEDWGRLSRCPVRYKIGPGKVSRNFNFDFRHPDGTCVDGFPVYCCIGEASECHDR